MKKLLTIFLLAVIPVLTSAGDSCGRECRTWDAFCKSDAQIIATKCRLGVPVYHEACRALGIKRSYYSNGGDMVEPMPCTAAEAGPGYDAISYYELGRK